jgi:hypothetical protein
MPLRMVFVAQIVPEEQEFCSYGLFVIDAESNRQDAILAFLTDRDRRRIGVELGIIANLGCDMPLDMRYELGASAANPLNFPPTPTFTSESGRSVWVIRDLQSHSL